MPVSIMEKIPLGRDSHLTENLATFVELLRCEGLPLGTTELIDALQALERVDLSDRTAFKTALRAALVKNKRDFAVFNRIFDHFFVDFNVHQKRAEQSNKYHQEQQEQISLADRDLQFKGESLQLSDEELHQYSSMTQDERDRLQDFLHKTETGKNVEPRFRPLLENVVKSHLRYCRNRDSEADNNAASGEGSGAGSGSTSTDQNIRAKDIEALRSSEMPFAEHLLQQLSRKLAVKILRRRRVGPRSGALDLRRSIRDNMRFGGVIFNLKRRPKRRSKQQILLLCDVSASMKQYSTFVIHFMMGLQDVVRNLSCFSFAEQVENLTPELKGRSGLQNVLESVVQHSKNWGGGTNLGSSLEELSRKYPDYLNAKTTMIIVSDTRTVSIDRALKALEKLDDRVKRIIWLNPLPLDRWSDYRSVNIIASKVEMWPCNTIAQLEEVLTGRL